MAEPLSLAAATACSASLVLADRSASCSEIGFAIVVLLIDSRTHQTARESLLRPEICPFHKPTRHLPKPHGRMSAVNAGSGWSVGKSDAPRARSTTHARWSS